MKKKKETPTSVRIHPLANRLINKAIQRRRAKGIKANRNLIVNECIIRVFGKGNKAVQASDWAFLLTKPVA